LNVVPFQGDFDGDGSTDLAYYNIANATWYMYDSSNSLTTSIQIGTPNTVVYQPGTSVIVPVSGYFSANSPAQVGLFNNGVWSIESPTGGVQTIHFGQAGDVPVAGDYYGVGYAELAYYRPSTQTFYIEDYNFQTGITTPEASISMASYLSTYGLSADAAHLVPVPANYEAQTVVEPAVYDPATGIFLIKKTAGPVAVNFQPGDIPAVADYTDSGSAQVVVYRQSTGQFIGQTSNIVATFGTSTDIPLTAPIGYRIPGVVSPAVITSPTPTATPTPTPTGTLGTGGTSLTTPTPTPTTTITPVTGPTTPLNVAPITTVTTVGQGTTTPVSTITPPTSLVSSHKHKLIKPAKKTAVHPKPSTHATKKSPKAAVSHSAKTVIKLAQPVTHQVAGKPKGSHVIDLALAAIDVKTASRKS
jgi:hypothetical protein